MAENEKLPVTEETTEEYAEVYTLTDEETGKEEQFELLGACELDGKTYYAMASAEIESDEYVILRVEESDDGIALFTIEDDDEFDHVADVFDDELFSEIDYDTENAES